mgnify:CR=1 FL=1
MRNTGPQDGGPSPDPRLGPARGGPSVWRMLLGARLRRLREEAGVSREDAAYAIRASASKMSRLELGRVGFKDRDVADLLTLYGVHDEDERTRLLAVVRRANAPQWWHRYGDVVPGWLETYIALEEAAHRVRVYATQLVPALLRTDEYARAVLDLCPPHRSAEELDRLVELEMERQRILTRPDPPRLWALIDESVLRRPVGGVRVMRRQLRHLVEMTAAPNVTLQILPARLGLGLPGGPFTLLRFQEPDLPDVVCLEQLGGVQYLERRHELDLYGGTLDALCARAAQPDRTAELVKEVLGELDRP